MRTRSLNALTALPLFVFPKGGMHKRLVASMLLCQLLENTSFPLSRFLGKKKLSIEAAHIFYLLILQGE